MICNTVLWKFQGYVRAHELTSAVPTCRRAGQLSRPHSYLQTYGQAIASGREGHWRTQLLVNCPCSGELLPARAHMGKE